jgi:hypothetical protein
MRCGGQLMADVLLVTPPLTAYFGPSPPVFGAGQ